jgi:hypothetical protein
MLDTVALLTDIRVGVSRYAKYWYISICTCDTVNPHQHQGLNVSCYPLNLALFFAFFLDEKQN